MFSINKTEETCCNAAQDAGKKLRAVVDHATDDARDAAASVAKQVRSNPLQSTAIAAGIGMLIGLLFSRR